MAYYVISYDIRSKNHQYQPLYDQLDAWAAKPLLDSVWVATIEKTASEVLDELKKHVHSNDSLAVVEIFRKSDWATRKSKPEGSQWLKDNIDQ